MADTAADQMVTVQKFTKGHRRQRTGVRFGSVQDRIASFEVINNRTASNTRPDVLQSNNSGRPSSAPADLPARKPADILPPIVFELRAGKGQLNKFKPGDEFRGNMVQRTVARLSSLQANDDADLEISNDELLDTRATRYSHLRTNTVATTTPRREISTAASMMKEPKSHTRSQSTPDQPRTPSPSRLVPANSRPNMFPSAFRMVDDNDQRPGSSHSISSFSTNSDAGPATPTSTTSSWLSWAMPLSPFAKRPASPGRSPPTTPVVHIRQTESMTLSPLQPDSDEFGLAQRKGIQDHWGDVSSHPVSQQRTVSRKLRWEDEESVRWTWF